MEYVVGLIFSGDHGSMVLLEKDHPEWQKGLLNGPGGVRQDHETYAEAMSRECKEETGLDIPPQEWDLTVMIHGWNNGPYTVAYLATTANLALAKTQTSEKVVVALMNELPQNLITDLHWIIPMIVLDELVEFPVYLNRKAGYEFKGMER